MNKVSAKISSIVDFTKGVMKEFKNLKFPSRLETMLYLVIVLVIAVIAATIFFIVDQLAYKFVRAIMIFFV